MEAISGFIGTLVTILIILTIVSISLLFVMRSKLNEEEAFTDIAITIGQLRKTRYMLSKQLVATFGNVPSAQGVRELLDIYPQVKNDADEKLWEKQFLPVMKQFLVDANAAASPQMAAVLQDIVNQFSDNEKELRSYRARYREAQEYMKRYERPPLSLVVGLGEIFVKATTAGVDKYNKARDMYDVFQENQAERRRHQEELMFNGKADDDE